MQNKSLMKSTDLHIMEYIMIVWIFMFVIHILTMTQSPGIQCTLKGQSLYLHFIQLLLSSMTLARCESLKPCTRLFWLRDNSERSQDIKSTATEISENLSSSKKCCLFVAHMWWCQFCYLSQMEKIWYFDIKYDILTLFIY